MSNTQEARQLQREAEQEYYNTAIDFTNPNTYLQENFSFKNLKEKTTYRKEKGNFEITLEKAGIFKAYNPNGTYEKYLRADIKIKNTSKEQDHLRIKDVAVIGNDNNQYEGKPTDFSTKIPIHPDMEKETYLLIKGIQEADIPKSKLHFSIGTNKIHKYEFDIPE